MELNKETQRGNTMRQQFIAALLTAFVAPAAADDVAPGGTIRAVYIGTNPAQATRDATTGTTRGPSYELTVELGKRLGMAVDVKPVAGPAAEPISASLPMSPRALERSSSRRLIFWCSKASSCSTARRSARSRTLTVP